MSEYEYDLFISYSRHGSVQKWLLNHFYDKLRESLADEYGSLNVYMDRQMPSAVHWPSNLRDALQRSKIMVQLLTPPYFQSPWCMAEMRSMQAREEMLGLAGNGVSSQGLIYPILYGDSENFPEEGKVRAWRDFKDVAYPDPSYQQSIEYNKFHLKVRELARDLAQLVAQAPPWRPDWPLVEVPEPVLLPTPPLPRFE